MAGEPLGPPEVYGDDRVFVSMALAGEADAGVEARLAGAGAGRASGGPPEAGRPLRPGPGVLPLGVRHRGGGRGAPDQPVRSAQRRREQGEHQGGAGQAEARPHRPPRRRSSSGSWPASGRATTSRSWPTCRRRRRTIASSPPSGSGSVTGSRSRPPWGTGRGSCTPPGSSTRAARRWGTSFRSPSRWRMTLPIPGEPFGFGELEAAQAEGDLQALRAAAGPPSGSTIPGCSRGDDHATSSSTSAGSSAAMAGTGSSAPRPRGISGSTLAELEDMHGEAVAMLEHGQDHAGRVPADSGVPPAPRLHAGRHSSPSCWRRARPFPDTIDLARALARTGRYRLMTLNNESAELNQHRIDSFGLRDIFIAFFSSCWVGVLKPARRIYEVALAMSAGRGRRRRSSSTTGSGTWSRRGRWGCRPFDFTDAARLRAGAGGLGVELDDGRPT